MFNHRIPPPKKRKNYLKSNYCIDCGKSISDNAKRCMSCASKKLRHSEKSKRKMRDAHKGKKLSEEHKGKIGESGKGKVVSRIGRERISKAKIGEKNPQWKGGKPRCIDCGKLLVNYRAKRCKTCFGKEYSKHYVKENHHCWKGGISKEPYGFEFDEKLRNEIRKRDSYECQNCNMTEEEHIVVLGKVLAVHHIDYDKKNNNKSNLITLCDQCNSRANYWRGYWREFYETKIMNKSEKKEVIQNE